MERVVPQLQAAIEEARRGIPDSPVYAFLEQVLSPTANSLKTDDSLTDDSTNLESNLDKYQKKLAEMWIYQAGIALDELIEEHSNSIFGVRAVGYYGLMGNLEGAAQIKVADFLYNYEQYDLSAKLYAECDKNNILGFKDLLYCGAAVSYTRPDKLNAQKGLAIMERARAMAKKKMDDNPNDLIAQKEYSYATQHITSILSWVWNITREEGDLQKVISEVRESIRTIEELLDKNVENISMSRYAQNLMRYAMFLRIAENDPDRMDVEKNFQKILSLKPGNELGSSASYQRWFQIFILADMGKYEDAQKRAQAAIALDIRYAMGDKETSVGRRQYSELRRLLETFSRFWRDQKSIARISQILNSAHLN